MIANSSHNPTKKPTAAIKIIIHSTGLAFRFGSYNSNGERSFLKKEKPKIPKKHTGSRKSFIPRKKYAIHTIKPASDGLEPYFFIATCCRKINNQYYPFPILNVCIFLKNQSYCRKSGNGKYSSFPPYQALSISNISYDIVTLVYTANYIDITIAEPP